MRGQKGRPNPFVPISGSGKSDYQSGLQQKSLFSSQSLLPPVTKPWYRWISGWPPHPSCCCGCGSQWRHLDAPCTLGCVKIKYWLTSKHYFFNPLTVRGNVKWGAVTVYSDTDFKVHQIDSSSCKKYGVLDFLPLSVVTPNLLHVIHPSMWYKWDKL